MEEMLGQDEREEGKDELLRRYTAEVLYLARSARLYTKLLQQPHFRL